MAAQHDTAKNAITDRIDGRQIRKLAKCKRVAASPISRNIESMSFGALCDEGHESWPNYSARISNEDGSSMYRGWTCSAPLMHPSGEAGKVLYAEIAWDALTDKPWKRMTVISPAGIVRRDREPASGGYHVSLNTPVFASAGNRNLKRLDNEIGTLADFSPERDPMPIVLHYMRGGHVSDGLDNHHSMGFVMRAARRRRWAPLNPVFFGNDPVDMLPYLNACPRRSEWTLIAYEDGSHAIVMAASTIHTRGPVSGAIYRAGDESFEWITASRDKRHAGEWTRSTGAIEDTAIVCRNSSGDKVSRQLPTGREKYRLFWNAAGARMEGAQPPVITPPPQQSLSDAQLIAAVSTKIREKKRPDAGLIIFDQVAKDSGIEWVDRTMRTAAEVMRLIAEDHDKPTATTGSKTLTRELEK